MADHDKASRNKTKRKLAGDQTM